MKPSFIFWIISLFVFSSLAHAQAKGEASGPAPPFVLGQVEHLHSQQLSEDRTLNIYLPEGYSPDSMKKYPVVYLLDGSANEDFIHIAGLMQFMTMIGKMPASILVGIANVDRKRDFTLPSQLAEDVKLVPTSGGSEKFIRFLEMEVQPYIDQHYHTSSRKTLIGQSLGGLLATEILLKKPMLFSDYIIISPSLWWNKESLLNDAPNLLRSSKAKALKVYVSVGTEGKQMEEDAANLSKQLQQNGPKDWQLHFVPLPKENHLTILHNSAYQAFELLNK